MSILTTEFDLETAKKVWSEEGREEERLEIAVKMLKRETHIDYIIEDTGLDD